MKTPSATNLPLKTTTDATLTIGRITYRVEPRPGMFAYELVGPRGGRTGLVRNIHSGLLLSTEPKFAGRVFTDASGRVELRSAS